MQRVFVSYPQMVESPEPYAVSTIAMYSPSWGIGIVTPAISQLEKKYIVNEWAWQVLCFNRNLGENSLFGEDGMRIIGSSIPTLFPGV